MCFFAEVPGSKRMSERFKGPLYDVNNEEWEKTVATVAPEQLELEEK